MIRVDARLAEVALAGFAERPFLGDDPPQRSVIVEWQKWIDAAGSPHLELRLTRGPLQSLKSRRVDSARTLGICLEQGGGAVAASSPKAQQNLS